MNQSNQQYDDKQSVSTKVAMPTKAASFTINRNRDMFKQASKQNKVVKQFHNLIDMQPEFSAYSISQQVHMLEDGDYFVVINDGHYTLVADRGKPHLIPRSIEPNSQLLYSNARKPASTIFMESVHRYSNKDYQNMLHVNVTKYNPEKNQTESHNTHLGIPMRKDGNQSTLVQFIGVQNSKKGLLLFEVQYNSDDNTTEYQLIYFSLINENKQKNPYFIHSKQSTKKFGEDSQDQSQRRSSNSDKQYIINDLKSIHKRITLKNTKEQYLKIINSQFGDALLFVTNNDIYNLEIDDGVIQLKAIKLSEQIAYTMNNNLEINQRFKAYTEDQRKAICQDLIVDVDYITNGLKVLFMTRGNFIGQMSAEKVTSFQSLHEIYEKKEKKLEKTLTIKKIHPMLNRLVIQEIKGEVIVLKENIFNPTPSALFHLQKIINLPIEGEEVANYQLKVLPKCEEIVLNKTVNSLPSKKVSLEVLKKGLMSPGNQFIPLYKTGYRAIQPWATQAKLSQQMSTTTITSTQDQQKTASVAEANGILCLLIENQVCFLRIYEGFTTESNQIQQLLNVHFFEKPLQVSIDPFGRIVVIVFKEFIKFFKFQYQDLENFYTYNVRNTNFAGFTDSGQYLMVVTQDSLYFINPYTYETQKIIEAYGQIKCVRYFDTSLYMMQKIKSKTNHSMLINCYLQQEGKYQKVTDIKLQAQQSYYVDRTHVIAVSKNAIRAYQYIADQNTFSSKYKLETKKIKLQEYYEYPTAVTLCEELGFIFVGTNFGKVYQFLWPFDSNQDGQSIIQQHVVQAHNSEICMIRVGTSLQKIYTFSKSKQVTQFQTNQFINGQQMTTPYTISPKTLYSDQIKYQFANREYLYQKYTCYIPKYQHETNEAVEQLKFIYEKLADDLQEQNNRNTQKLSIDSQELQKEKAIALKSIEKQLKEYQTVSQNNAQEIRELAEDQDFRNNDKIKKQIEQYEKSILDLYKEGDRLRKIYKQQDEIYTRERDRHQINNQMVREKLIEQCQREKEKYIQQYANISVNAQQYGKLLKVENQEGDYELQEYKKYMHKAVQEQLMFEQTHKQSLLGSIQHYIKEINNYKQRKDEFETLMMETYMQIEELKEDQKTYANKKEYLQKELSSKEEMIEQKQKELIIFVKNTQNMKKLKNTHEFQLDVYENQFLPINQRMAEIDQKIKRMNEQILNQFNSKQNSIDRIHKNELKEKNLKKLRETKLLKKHNAKVRLSRLLSQLALILQADPLSIDLQKKLNDIINGETFEINAEEIEQRANNAKLMRKKDLIRKQIEDSEKHQQQIVRNKNLYFQYYKDNTSLVVYFNELKKEESALIHKKEVMEKRIEDIRHKIRDTLSSKTQLRRNRSEKSYSLQTSGKKLSEKLLTPYQRYEQDQVNLLMAAKGNTQQTKVGTYRKKNDKSESNSLLHTLIKDFQHSDSRYEKMEIVRERVRSFVNPQIRPRNTKKDLANMQVQKVLFQSRKLSQLIKQ